MITINDSTAQAVINALKQQREDALDAVAIHASTLALRDARIKELEEKLNQPSNV